MLEGPMRPPASGGAAQSMVIFLHGYGSNGDDLIGLADYWRGALPDTVFISPNAPEICPGAPDGYQWWGLSNLTPGGRAAGVRKPAEGLNAFIDAQLAQFGLPEARLALVGFSQGTMMALHVGPRRAQALAGIVGFSGMLADPDELLTEVVNRPPVLLVHGDADEVLPVASLARAKQGLEAAGVDVVTHVSPRLGHSIDEMGLRLGATFLAHRLSRPAADG
jgi:phospholipase/carboxylesterase